MIERLAEWYLRRRGRIVLGRCFIGMAIGYASAVKESHCWCIYPNAPDALFQIIAINNSIIHQTIPDGTYGLDVEIGAEG